MVEAAEIEITPKMVEVGVELLREWDSDYYDGPLHSPSELVFAIFAKMASASLSNPA